MIFKFINRLINPKKYLYHRHRKVFDVYDAYYQEHIDEFNKLILSYMRWGKKEFSVTMSEQCYKDIKPMLEKYYSNYEINAKINPDASMIQRGLFYRITVNWS